MSENQGLDSRAFRNALGCFATGVTVVTTRTANGDGIGITMNSFASVSLDPPLILFSLAKTSEYYDEFMKADKFAVNVLTEHQEEHSARFSTTGRAPLADDEYEIWITGSPILKDAHSAFDCTIDKRVEAGDHVIFLCLVHKAEHGADAKPLVFHRSAYAKLM